MFDTLKTLLGWPWFPRRKPDPLPEKETDLAYGPDPLQKLDVYRPPNTMPGGKLPVILMVHGGGWDNTLGDKANAGVIDNKAAYYVPKGYVVVSMNYRLYPQVTPYEEQQDVAYAFAFVQKMKGVDPKRVGLMGHSAGGTNVAVAAASMVSPCWVVCLDAGTLDALAALEMTFTIQRLPLRCGQTASGLSVGLSRLPHAHTLRRNKARCNGGHPLPGRRSSRNCQAMVIRWRCARDARSRRDAASLTMGQC